MCGIAGAFNRTMKVSVSEDYLKGMISRIRHRGPEDTGVKTFGAVGLAHARLRIIDLSERGRQPMCNEDGTIWLTFNGEIYNYAQLRERLRAAGHVFASDTDSEVIIHLYEEDGLLGLERLDGMFAFGLWDSRTRSLILARDRTGKKPLFIYEKAGLLLFGSEPKVFWSDPDADRSMDESAIPEYLAHGYVPTPHTFYRFVRKLPPGHVKVVSDDETSERMYWSYPLSSVRRPTISEAAREVRGRLEDAVRRRLVADVPMGAFLSGGVDSSIIVALMQRASDAPVRTFSLGFPSDPRFDESPYARRVAAELGTDHTELMVEPDSFKLLPKVLSIWDEPFGDASAIPTYIVSRLAREHTTVVLTGDGGDEVFAGYPRFTSVYYTEFVPRGLRQWVSRAAGRAPLPKNRESLVAKAIRFGHRMGPELPERLHRWVSVFTPEEVDSILGRSASGEEDAAVYARILKGETIDDPLNLCLRLNAKSYLLDDLNVKVDRATMAHALEARAPFLDTALIEYVFQLPGEYKINAGRRKHVLRHACKDLVPSWVFARRKAGFGLPLGLWLRGAARTLVEDLLRAPSTRLYSVLDKRFVYRMLDEHMSSRRDRGHQIWALLMLESWLERESNHRLGTETMSTTAV